MRELLPNEAIRRELRLAEQAGMHGEHGRAQEICQKVLDALDEHEDAPPHLRARAHHGIGLALAFQGNLADGLAHLEQAIHNDPQTHGYALDLARAYLKLGMVDKARLWARRAKVLGSADKEAEAMENPTPSEPAEVQPVEGNVVAPLRFLASGIACGIKESGAPDLTLICSEVPCVVAGTFTTSRMCAAPVQVSRERVAGGTAQCIVANSGNANCATGEQGLQDARQMAKMAAEAVGCDEELTLPASTGKIGMPLPMANVQRGIRGAGQRLGRDAESAQMAARAIMTTDTVAKQIAVQVTIGGWPVRIGGIAKGAGMICPNMATMLCFITTDAAVERPALQSALSQAVGVSFNRITVDGDMSTNDTVILLANGCADNAAIADESGAEFGQFLQALSFVTTHLARAIARDGEGATKLVQITVEGAANDEDAHRIAKSIANSPLVKTALHGADPNWGRIASSAGAAGVDFRQENLRIWFDDLLIVDAGAGVDFDPAAAHEILLRDEYPIRVAIGDGPGAATAWTCDLSNDYIAINAEYHT